MPSVTVETSATQQKTSAMQQEAARRQRPEETEFPNKEESDIALVEKAYLYITTGKYPEGVTKNEKRTLDGKQID